MENDKVQQVKRKKYRRKFFDIKDGYNLIKFINKIPNLQEIKFRLSDEECKVVGQNQNLIVIGRSGTGKTTCALMRMCSIQILYKNSKAKQKHIAQGNQKQYFCRSKNIDQTYGIKNIFLTASPMLINQIRAKYEQLKMHVKMELDNAEKRRNFIQNTQQNQLPQVQHFGLDEINNAQMIARQRENIYNSFHNLEDKDFPGFFTIKEFLIMLDGVLTNSFFLRDNKRCRIFNTKDVQIDNDKKMYKIKIKQKQVFAKQCKWQIFLNQFWSKCRAKEIIRQKKKYSKGEFRDISALAVWTEILSTIKGQFSSHSYPKRYLPLNKYLQLSKSKYYKQAQKQAIYEIFLNYQEWKHISPIKYYDNLDLVNHLFANIQDYFQYANTEHIFFKDSPVQFNYLFLDQVQDLPPVVPYLISQMFTDGLYFSGDSAQAIQKGIAFKFSDIKSMFHKEFPYPPLFFQNPKLHELTVNFRSHQNILYIANSLIRMLEKLYPHSIDILNKEQSKLKGPKPIYLNFECQETIKYLLIQDKSGKLGSNCAIIVRNNSSKSNLPKELQKLNGLVLTIEQSKGMQFNDVIMYNFFDPKLTSLWKILKYLQMYPKQGSKEFHIQQINKDDYLQIVTEIKLVYTLITRTKCTLIIYQMNLPEELLLIWTNLGYIYTHKDITRMKQQRTQYYKNIKQSARQITWEQRGYIFYMKKQYDLAYQCYSNAGMYEVCNKIIAIKTFQQAKRFLKNLRQKHSVQRYQANYSQQQLLQCEPYKRFVKQCQQQVNKKLQEAGKLFQGSKVYLQAGHCFYLCGKYDQALINYLSVNQEEVYYKIAVCYQHQKMYKQAAEYYRKGRKFPQMLQALQKFNDFKIIIHQLKNSQYFLGKEVYYRKYCHILIVKKKYNNIDLGQTVPNEKISFTQGRIDQQSLAFQQIFLMYCEQSVNRIKDRLHHHPLNQCILEYSKINEQESYSFIENKVKTLNLFINLQSKYLVQNQKQAEKRVGLLKILQNLKQKQINIKAEQKSILQSIKNNQNLITRFHQFYNFYSSSCMKQILSAQIQLIELEEQKQKILKQISQQQSELKITIQIQKKNNHQILAINSKISQQMFLDRIKQFIASFQSFIKFQLYERLGLKNLLSRQLTIIKFIKNNYDTIQKQIQQQIYLAVHKIKEFFQNYYNKLQSLTQNILSKNCEVDEQFLNDILFENKDEVSDIIYVLKMNLFKNIEHLLKQQKKRLSYIGYQRIHSSNCQLPSLPILRSNQKDSKAKQKNALDQIIYQFADIQLKIFKPQKITTLQNRKDQLKIEGHTNRLSKFKLVSQVAMQRQCERRNSWQFAYLNNLQTFSPRAVIGLSYLQNFKEKAIQSLICQISYLSTCYIKKHTSFVLLDKIKAQEPKDKKAKDNKKKSYRIIQIINPKFFNFQIYRTKYRFQSSANQLIEASILLGLHQPFQRLFSEKLNIKLWLIYMDKKKIYQFYKNFYKIKDQKDQQKFVLDKNNEQSVEDKGSWYKQAEKKSEIDQNVMNEVNSIILIDQYIEMDSVQTDSWYKQQNINIDQYLNQVQKGQVKTQMWKIINGQTQQNQRRLGQLIRRIKQQDYRQVQKLYEEYCKSEPKQVQVEPKQFTQYKNIQNIVKYNQIYQIYKGQIDIYQKILVESRKTTYAQICKEHPKIYQVYNQQIQKIINIFQTLINNKQYQFPQQQIKQFTTFKENLSELKYNFLINPITAQLIALIDKQVGACFKHLNSKKIEISFSKDIYDHLDQLIYEFNDQDSQLQYMFVQIQDITVYKRFNQDRRFILQKISTIKHKMKKFQQDHRNYQSNKNQINQKQYYLFPKMTQQKISNKKYQELTKRFLKNNLIQLLFLHKEGQQLICYFNNLCYYSYYSKYNKIQILLIYFSYWRSNRIYNMIINSRNVKALQLFYINIDKITTILLTPLQNKLHLQFYCCLLDILKVKLVINCPFMTIFQNMVFVSKTSILVKSKQFNIDNFFCYHAQERGEVYLMKLNQVSLFISEHILKDFPQRSLPIIKENNFINLALLAYNIEGQVEYSSKQSKLMMTIQQNKERLLHFFYRNQFVSHQSFLFVYHQLKEYYDLTTMLRLSRHFGRQIYRVTYQQIQSSLKQNFKNGKIMQISVKFIKRYQGMSDFYKIISLVQFEYFISKNQGALYSSINLIQSFLFFFDP